MMLGIKVVIDKKATKINFNLENKFGQNLKIKEIYLYTSIGLVSVNGEARHLKPSETWDFSVSAAIFNIPNHKYSLLIASENVTYDFVEQYHITLKKKRFITDASTNSGELLKSGKLHEYPVTKCISNLYKNEFKKDGVYTKDDTESKLLLEQIK